MTKRRAFSFLEISIVILVVGLIIAGLMQSSRVIAQIRLNSARSQSISSGILAIEDLALWLDSTAEKRIISTTNYTNPDNGDKVSIWMDSNSQLSNKNDATQATDANRPTYATASINGLPSIKFNGTSNYFTLNNVFTKDFTLFIVIRTTTVGGGGHSYGGNSILWADAQTNGYDSIPLAIGGGYANSFNGNPDSTINSGVTVNNDAAHVITVQRSLDSGARTIIVDSNSTTTDSNGAAGTILNDNMTLVLGTNLIDSRYYSGYIGEIIVYSRVLPIEERKIVEKYLGKKWGVKII